MAASSGTTISTCSRSKQLRCLTGISSHGWRRVTKLQSITCFFNSPLATTSPEPISTSIDGIWPMMRNVHMLNLEPKDPNGIISAESRQTNDGNWKNQTDHGVPVYVTVESASKDKLQALRETLIGRAAVL